MNKVKKAFHYHIKMLEYVVLGIIVIATAFVIGDEIMKIFKVGEVTLADILLLFIYLEVLAMVSIFITSGEFPVRIPLYIGIVALTRHIIIDISHMSNTTLLSIGGTVIMLAAAALIIKICRK
jgi:protein PsiE